MKKSFSFALKQQNISDIVIFLVFAGKFVYAHIYQILKSSKNC